MPQPGTLQAHIEEMTTILKPAKSKTPQEGTTTLTRDEIAMSPSGLQTDSAFAPDDIPDPEIPAQMLADIETDRRACQPTVDPGTVAGQVAMSVDEALERFTQSAFPVLASVEKAWESTLEVCQGNQAVIEALTAALTAYKPIIPYAATVSVITPAGYPLSFSLQAESLQVFMRQMGEILTFFQDNEFKPGVVQGVPF